MKLSKDLQGSSPSCILSSLLNAREKQDGIDLDPTVIFDWYSRAGIASDKIGDQTFPRIAKKMATIPLAGKTLKEPKRIYSWYDRKSVGVLKDISDVWPLIDPKKCYVFGCSIWKHNGKTIPLGEITWGPKHGSYEGDILPTAPAGPHVVSFLDKRGDHHKGYVLLENSWKTQHVAKIMAKNMLKEVREIWEVEFE